MADRAMMYCPLCDRVNPGMNTELLRDNHTYKCMFGHVIEGYEAVLSLNPRMIPLEFHEKPGPNDVKVEFWINPTVLEKFRSRHPQQQSSTVNSILSLYAVGEPVIIDGKQAADLRKLGVKNGAEVLALVETSKALEVENDELKGKLEFLRSMFKSADVESPV